MLGGIGGFLGLIFFSSFSDYLISSFIGSSQEDRKRKRLLYLSIVINLTTLFFFKYFNFFVDSFKEFIWGSRVGADDPFLDIVLPVGISFYTFQSMSYTIDVYRKDIKPANNLIEFLAYISFFPQLVAGPIERASQLLPQFTKKRTFAYDTAVDGLRQVLWGVLKKVVIADNCAIFVNSIFENYPDHSGSTLLLGMFIFAFNFIVIFRVIPI